MNNTKNISIFKIKNPSKKGYVSKDINLYQRVLLVFIISLISIFLLGFFI